MPLPARVIGTECVLGPQRQERSGEIVIHCSETLLPPNPLPHIGVYGRRQFRRGGKVEVNHSESRILSFISSELALISGAYIALARVGKALNWPGISARTR